MSYSTSSAIGTMKSFLVLWCCYTCVLSITDKTSPRVIIIGAGSAGIAAASRLFENGFNNVTILEAENKIGGRIHSVPMGNYMVDLGGQLVYGEMGNVVFELAWPLGVLARHSNVDNMSMRLFGSSGLLLSPNISHDIFTFHTSLNTNLMNVNISVLSTDSYGEYADREYDKYFNTHSEINSDLHEPLRYAINLGQMTSDAADTWYKVSVKRLQEYAYTEGDYNINWKNRTFSTILEILMKKFPNPEDELPVLNNTHTRTIVTRIDYGEESAPIKILTANGKEYLADHVIFTPSLGVLKANYEQLFHPPLPEKKIAVIQNLGYGYGAKILLFYKNPWWYTNEAKNSMGVIFWTENDRREIENDPEKKWMLGIFGLMPIEHRPKLLCIWMSSNYSIEMELIPDELFRNQTIEFIQRFFGREYNLTEPTEIRRTLWNTNENFRGTYSYHSVETVTANVTNSDLAEPIMRDNTPILQFAGEATSEYYATVNGAIESGWREADRLIRLYSSKNISKNE